MTPFLTNLLLFSPLLALAALILYVLDRADHLRRGSGLLPPEPQPVVTEEPEETEPLLNESQDPPELIDSEESDGDLDLDEDFDDYAAVHPNAEFPPPYAELDAGADADTGANPNPTGLEPPIAPIQPIPTTARTRTVGAKKARSLARRDQRRAYHEFLRSQQDERTRTAAAEAEEHDERIFAEKRRRALVEEEIAERQRAERAERLEKERLAEAKRRADAKTLRGIVSGGGERGRCWRLGELAGKLGRSEEWVGSTLRKEGMVGVKEGVWGMLTEEGWYVRVGKREMGILYEELERRGKMEWGEMAEVIEAAVRD